MIVVGQAAREQEKFCVNDSDWQERGYVSPTADDGSTKLYKPGKVAVVLSGRQAGKKVVVIKQQDDGTKDRPYPHAVVAGIERYPLKVTKNMGKKRIARRSKVKPFIKVINYSHLLPTRYQLELESLKGSVSNETFKEPTQREDAKKAIKKAFEERYAKGNSRWFFSKLRF
ncbi:50S small subunit ribosomal protein L27e [Kwoniella heveanensis BCC8398]|uniref:50S small subunit ribosomal protein L27e n=1 Tax=Kwoniella heveanensis BCC8398 TaxID=1296120 RepID=A0A1B9GL97_9TREE|nr:50S small subunit ribosomal protein L27e [Kwoniella heveanensis BCC8398]